MKTKGITYGYMRVSTKEQNEDRQLIAMNEMEIPEKNIYMDKQSGKDFERPAYRKLLKKIKKNDVLIVKSIDRLGRNYKDIMEQWRIITKEIGADIVILDMPLLDTTSCRDLMGTFISDIVLQLLSFVAENERDNIRRRQAEGIAAAKLRGTAFGNKVIPLPKGFAKYVKQLDRKEINMKELAVICKVAPSTMYSKLKKYRHELQLPQEVQ